MSTSRLIPADLAKRLKLEEGFGVTLSTANGLSQGYRTKIDRLQLGDIVLRDVRALVAPGLHGDQVLDRQVRRGEQHHREGEQRQRARGQGEVRAEDGLEEGVG